MWSGQEGKHGAFQIVAGCCVGRVRASTDTWFLFSFGVPGVNATFDYVVVGGGTAGLAIATRLVEQRAGTVAVVEAGTFYELCNGNASQVPGPGVNYAGKSALDWQPLIDWGYMTTPQPGANNVSLHYARGKALGGSSARNTMIYQRGTTASYQQWANQVGDATYTFEKFLPYFGKSINFSAPDMSVRLNKFDRLCELLLAKIKE